MKLLYRANSLEEANELKASLEMAGIPAMISGENFSALRIPLFPNNLGVFIYLDEQYNDALQVMDNPEFIPETAVDTEEFYQLQDSEEFRHKINTGYLTILGWLISFILLLIFLLNYLLY